MKLRTSSADHLLDDYWVPEPEAIAPRELATEAVVAAAFAAAAGLFALLAPGAGKSSVPLCAVFVGAYAIACAIKFPVGAGYAVPTQLVLVPMLLLLEPGLVPPLVAAGLVLGSLPDVIRGRNQPGYLLSAVADAWHSLGGAAVFAVAGGDRWGLAAVWLYAAAFVAQAALDTAVPMLRQWIGRGIPPHRQPAALGTIQVIDALLWPVGFLAAQASRGHEYAWTLALAVAVLLGLLARDRNARVAQAQHRLEALRHERSRFEQAIRRVGEAFATNLDRERLLELTLRTALDATGADAGRTSVGAEIWPEEDLADEAEARAALVAAEAVAAARRAPAEAAVGGRFALACPVPLPSASTLPLLSVTRTSERFGDEDREVLAYLAGQAAVSIENAELHELLQHQATTDGLTGLANHRRFQERLELELADARVSGRPLGLVLLDIDDFKRINDTLGHQLGDEVLKQVGAALRQCCSDADEPARYGGEEFALILPDLDEEQVLVVAERIRVAITEAVVLAPGGQLVRVTASLGLVVCHAGAGDPRTLLSAADTALYQAKAQGKNCTVRAGDETSKRAA